MRFSRLFSTAVCALLMGCTGGDSSQADVSSRASDVKYVCIGMETSKRFGKCPGCKLDSDRINALLRDRYGYSGVLLQSESATRSSVISNLKSAVSSVGPDGLFILYYSGHGGQEQLDWNTEEPSGYDSEDEYLCLYDSYLLDDEIWKIISCCNGRVFMCFDACHSQTMYRSVAIEIAKDKGFAVPLEDYEVRSTGLSMKAPAFPMGEGGIRMLCWSGCLEKEYSYGSSRGGIMTNAILNHWKMGKSYEDLWKCVTDEIKAIDNGQHPYATGIGTGFSEVFR